MNTFVTTSQLAINTYLPIYLIWSESQSHMMLSWYHTVLCRGIDGLKLFPPSF